jgi:hypothetical protein
MRAVRQKLASSNSGNSTTNAWGCIAAERNCAELFSVRDSGHGFCCLPAGIPATVYAAQVNSKMQGGDLAGAQAASNNAKMWYLISLGLGLGSIVLYGVLIMAGVLSCIHQH